MTEDGFHWLGDYEITADELLGGVTPKTNKRERAKRLIYELAETNSMVKSEDIVTLAEENKSQNERWKTQKKSWVLKENESEKRGIGHLMKS